MPSTDPLSVKDADRLLIDHARTTLLHDLSSFRNGLARSIARNNHGLASDTIAAATNRIIGRLIFLRIAEDRRLIQDGTLQQIHDAADPLTTVSELFLQNDDPWKEIPVTGLHQMATTDPVLPEVRVIQKILQIGRAHV